MRENRGRKLHVIRTTWREGNEILASPAPVQAWDPPNDTTRPYIPEAPVQ